MTRVLSELLGAGEPMFHHGISRLESASGHLSTDIKLSCDIERTAKRKLAELLLDPTNTTSHELYAALQQKVKADDLALANRLESLYSTALPHERIAHALMDLPIDRSCYSLKTAVGKKLLAKMPPRQSMKALGYRSYDSMMRRESLLAVFAAAWALESSGWRKFMLDSLAKLKPSEFEIRQLSVIAPAATRWQSVAQCITDKKKHMVVGLKEFGAIVILPFPDNAPPSATLAVLLLGLQELNEVHAASTYMKYCQVRPDFGNCLRNIVASEPQIGLDIFGHGMPWQVIQRFYAQYSDRYRPELFEPHVQKEDLAWHSMEDMVHHIEPRIKFWQGTHCAGLLDGHETVSLNVLDNVLSLCNKLPFENRIVHFFRHNLWHELLNRYLYLQPIGQAVFEQVETDLAGPAELL